MEVIKIKSAKDIQSDLSNNFNQLTNETIAPGSVIDLYNTATSKVYEDLYLEIENNKTPHIWSNLEGEKLDDTGIWVNLPRKDGENDNNYKYRLQNWMLSAESSNTTAIQNALTNLQYASNVDYQPYTKGTGTGACYIIPKNYDINTINNALNEVHDIIKQVASPSLYIEYIIPTVRTVKLQIYMVTNNGDIEVIKTNLSNAIANYINSIPPNEYLEIGEINKIGINTNNVSYFNVISILIDNLNVGDIRVLQTIDSKMLFDKIIWIEGDM